MTTPEDIESTFAPMDGRDHAGVPEGAKTAWFRSHDPRTEEGKAKRLTDWGQGPWWGEPDRVEWRAHGLPCLVVRNPMGALCGYVGVPPGHPCHGRGYDDEGVPECGHGGLTYAAACAHRVCHVPLPGEPDAVWWFGFDCVHAFDLAPGLRQSMLHHEPWWTGPRPILSSGLATDYEEREDHADVYRAMPYVAAEVERVAEALAMVAEVERLTVPREVAT